MVEELGKWEKLITQHDKLALKLEKAKVKLVTL